MLKPRLADRGVGWERRGERSSQAQKGCSGPWAEKCLEAARGWSAGSKGKECGGPEVSQAGAMAKVRQGALDGVSVGK